MIHKTELQKIFASTELAIPWDWVHPLVSIEQHPFATFLVFVLVMCAGFLIWLKSPGPALHLVVSPDLVTIEGGESFGGEFSSASRFIVSRKSFYKTVQAVAHRESLFRGRMWAAKESVCVTIEPGEAGITELERDAIAEVFSAEFVSVEIVA